ncbi:MAG: XisI protein [Chloroflexota bacterium]
MVRTVEKSEQYRQIVQGMLNQYAQIPYAHDDLADETIFDREADRYLLLTLGWQGQRRINNVILHIDIQDEQVWIQCNNTDQDIASELVEKGIAVSDVILPRPTAILH